MRGYSDSMNEVMRNILDRRSVRSYTDERVPEDILREIIKAGTHAPNGMGVRPLRFVVVTDQDTMKKLSDTAKQLFTAMLQRSGPSEQTEGMVRTLSNPDFHIFYHAPALVLVFTAPSSLTPVEDGALAAENMMLAARSFGLGSCWIGFAKPLMYSPEFMSEAEVPEGHQLIAPLIFGHPRKEPAPADRGEPEILKWIG